MIKPDTRPRTVILQHDLGIGDLIFRLPYILAIAEQSRGGMVSLIARPTCCPHDLLRAETCIERIIDYDRWRKQDRKGRHRGLLGHWRLTCEIRAGAFDRIVIFSDKLRYGLMATMARIPERIGYGGSGLCWFQRLFLTKKPFIQEYQGPLNSNYQTGSLLAIQHGFVQGPVVPRLNVPKEMVRFWENRLSALPRVRLCFAVGASDKKKDWGWQNFAMLAEELLRRGNGVICLGGKAEEGLLQQLHDQVAPSLRADLQLLVPPSVLDSAAITHGCAACIGNDTGMLNVAAACGIPTVLLIGNRPSLGHDPAIVPVKAESVAAIRLTNVLDALHSLGLC